MAQVLIRSLIHGGSLLLRRCNHEKYVLSQIKTCKLKCLHVKRFSVASSCLLHPRGYNSTRKSALPQLEQAAPDSVQSMEKYLPPENLELSVVEKPVKLGHVDLALHKAMKKMSATEILAVILARNESMDKLDLAIATKQLYRLGTHLGPEDLCQYKEFLASNLGFQVLYALLALKGRYLEADIAAEMLRFLHFLGLDSHSPTIKVYMQLMKFHVNDLSLVDLIRLGEALSRMTPTTQTKTLNEGIRATCDMKRRDVSLLNTWELAYLLHLYGSSMDQDVCLDICENLLELQASIGTSLCTLIFCSLGKVDWCHYPLEQMCFAKIVNNLEKLKFTELVKVLESCVSLGIYNHHFYQTLTAVTVEQNVAFEDRLRVFSLLEKASYYPVRLVSSVLQILNQNSRLIDSLTPVETVILMELLSSCKYVTRMRNVALPTELSKIITDGNFYLPSVSSLPPETLLNLVVSMHLQGDGYSAPVCDILMNLDVQALVSSDLHRDKNDVESSEDSKTSTEDFLQQPAAKFLIAASRLDQSGDNFLKFLQDLKDKFRNVYSSIPSTLRRDLVSIVGANHVQDNVQSATGLMIDHVLPDFSFPGTDIRTDIAVLLLPPENFYWNINQLKSISQCHVKHLVDSGYHVMVINSSFWSEVPERERAPLLQRQLELMNKGENPCFLT